MHRMPRPCHIRAPLLTAILLAAYLLPAVLLLSGFLPGCTDLLEETTGFEDTSGSNYSAGQMFGIAEATGLPNVLHYNLTYTKQVIIEGSNGFEGGNETLNYIVSFELYDNFYVIRTTAKDAVISAYENGTVCAASRGAIGGAGSSDIACVSGKAPAAAYADLKQALISDQYKNICIEGSSAGGTGTAATIIATAATAMYSDPLAISATFCYDGMGRLDNMTAYHDGYTEKWKRVTG